MDCPSTSQQVAGNAAGVNERQLMPPGFAPRAARLINLAVHRPVEASKQRRDQVGRSIQQVLAVINYEQGLTRAEVVDQLIDRRSGFHQRKIEGSGNRHREQS
jgi:hypothetical protein